MKAIFFNKQLLLVALSFSLSVSLFSQNLRTPRPSPPVETKMTIGLTEITVNYSSPSVKRDGSDRTGSIWGGPAWYGFLETGNGKIPWRAGANENTVISFSDDVKIQGEDLKAGNYGLQMAVFEDGKVTVIFSNNSSLWGSFGYKPEEDALRVSTKLEESAFTNMLTYSFSEVGKDYGILNLAWENKRIPIKITVDAEAAVLANFRAQLAHGKDKSWQGPNDAAAYCAQNNFNHQEALHWIEQSIAMDKNARNMSTKAQLLFQTGKKKEAIVVTDDIAQHADINALNNLGYQMIQMEQYDKAVEYLMLNVERNPKDANCRDSLGEAYMAKGDNKKAIENFQKALTLDPPGFVRDNSIANLKKLGVEYREK